MILSITTFEGLLSSLNINGLIVDEERELNATNFVIQESSNFKHARFLFKTINFLISQKHIQTREHLKDFLNGSSLFHLPNSFKIDNQDILLEDIFVYFLENLGTTLNFLYENIAEVKGSFTIQDILINYFDFSSFGFEAALSTKVDSTKTSPITLTERIKTWIKLFSTSEISENIPGETLPEDGILIFKELLGIKNNSSDVSGNEFIRPYQFHYNFESIRQAIFRTFSVRSYFNWIEQIYKGKYEEVTPEHLDDLKKYSFVTLYLLMHEQDRFKGFHMTDFNSMSLKLRDAEDTSLTTYADKLLTDEALSIEQDMIALFSSLRQHKVDKLNNTIFFLQFRMIIGKGSVVPNFNINSPPDNIKLAFSEITSLILEEYTDCIDQYPINSFLQHIDNKLDPRWESFTSEEKSKKAAKLLNELLKLKCD